MIENSNYKLSSNCRFMNICGVDIIGNPNTGVVIGLDAEGGDLIQKLKQGIPYSMETLTENQQLLLNALVDNGFFSEQAAHYKVRCSYLHVTSHCNLNCEGCYSYEANRNGVPDLSLPEIKRILDNLSKAGLDELVVSGGEPFFREDLIDILQYAKNDLHIKSIQCISNGTASFERYLNASKYLDMLTFSLDSSDSKTAVIRPQQVFENVVEKMRMLKAAGVNTAIVFTIHHENVARCDELSAFANRLGVQYRFSIFTVQECNGLKSPLTLTDEDYATLREFVERQMLGAVIADTPIGGELGCVLACGAGKANVSISSDGKIYPCHMFVGMSQFCLGSALENDIANVVNDTGINPFLSLCVDTFEKCKDCHIRYVCGGGCRFRAYAVNKSIYQPDKLCDTYIYNKEQTILSLLNS